MKCSLVRDLLPLYIEGDCSVETNRQVKEHITSCTDCQELYEMMEAPLDVNVTVGPEVDSHSSDFWEKYYGRLILRGIGLFFLIYVIIVVLIGFIK
ncbi:anti-sigma factor [Anaerobacillus alkaliphilus]|uniref:Anti-sigma factor n=1 Tax=Anaerobacillus alkaliphilus TaxID=1548597 RepID=A0A4Q0VN66_9BACI|nr:zf-HC2 domain-containing protein [Anaerobacillus alkaliphilus]RXI96494.1 anti-sigma factor [Anaerobacillus alkaliphilus]